MLGGMTRRPTRLESKASNRYLVAIAQRLMVELLVAKLAGIDGGASRPVKLERARNEIGVDMRLENRADAEISLGSPIEIDLHVTARIDDRNISSRFVGDQIRDLCEARGEHAIDNHLETVPI